MAVFVQINGTSNFYKSENVSITKKLSASSEKHCSINMGNYTSKKYIATFLVLHRAQNATSRTECHVCPYVRMFR